jgi:hypothetical protein
MILRMWKSDSYTVIVAIKRLSCVLFPGRRAAGAAQAPA